MAPRIASPIPFDTHSNANEWTTLYQSPGSAFVKAELSSGQSGQLIFVSSRQDTLVAPFQADRWEFWTGREIDDDDATLVAADHYGQAVWLKGPVSVWLTTENGEPFEVPAPEESPVP